MVECSGEAGSCVLAWADVRGWNTPDSNTDLAAGETDSRFGSVRWIAPDHSYLEMAEGQSRMSGDARKREGKKRERFSEYYKTLQGPEVLQKQTADGG